MAVLQDLWTQIKGKLDGNVALTAFLKIPIIYGYQETPINALPALVVEFGTPVIEEKYFTVPQKKTADLKIQFNGKVKATTSAGAMLEALHMYELLLNALDVDIYYAGKLLIISEVRMESADSMDGDGFIKDITVNATFTTQRFNMGAR